MPEKLEKELRFLRDRDAAFAFTGYEFADGQGRGTGKVVHVPETSGNGLRQMPLRVIDRYDDADQLIHSSPLFFPYPHVPAQNSAKTI